MQIAGDSLAERAPNEAVYDQSDTSLGDPYGIPVRRMDAHGGWIASVVDLTRSSRQWMGCQRAPTSCVPRRSTG